MSVKKLNISIFIFLISFYVYPNKVITGTVIDCKTNLPFPGVEIIVEGNNKKAISDFDGFFEIIIPDEIDEITIIYKKYRETKISVQTNRNLGKIILFKRGCKKNK